MTVGLCADLIKFFPNISISLCIQLFHMNKKIFANRFVKQRGFGRIQQNQLTCFQKCIIVKFKQFKF